jgi:hypothetical protein
MSGSEPEHPDERPWEQQGAVRRDCEPHRAEFLLTLAYISVFFAFVSLCCWILAPISLGLGILVWAMAARDLALMHRGLLDPRGKERTAQAKHNAQAAILVTAVFATFWVRVWVSNPRWELFFLLK